MRFAWYLLTLSCFVSERFVTSKGKAGVRREGWLKSGNAAACGAQVQLWQQDQTQNLGECYQARVRIVDILDFDHQDLREDE